jgi:hypothetical protein
MQFHCALVGEYDKKLTLFFSEKKEFLVKQPLLSKIIEYEIGNFVELDKLAHKVYLGSWDPNLPQRFSPRDGYMTIRPPNDPVYDFHILKYWFYETDKDRVLSGFNIDNL